MSASIAIMAFIFAALLATYLKQSGGPFRLLFTFIAVVAIGVPFASAYAVEAPLTVIATITGFIVGLLT